MQVQVIAEHWTPSCVHPFSVQPNWLGFPVPQPLAQEFVQLSQVTVGHAFVPVHSNVSVHCVDAPMTFRS